jgi:hypothetical protein
MTNIGPSAQKDILRAALNAAFKNFASPPKGADNPKRSPPSNERIKAIDPLVVRHIQG